MVGVSPNKIIVYESNDHSMVPRNTRVVVKRQPMPNGGLIERYFFVPLTILLTGQLKQLMNKILCIFIILTHDKDQD